MGYALAIVIVALGIALTNRPLTNSEWDDILEDE